MEIDSTPVEEEPAALSSGETVNGSNLDSHESKESSLDTEEPVPKVGMVFNTEEEICDYFKRYAYQQGFGVRKVSTKSDTDRQARYYSLACSRGGKNLSTAKNYLTARPSIKTDCKAKINVIVSSDGGCTISRVFLEHNHALSPKNSKFQRSHWKRGNYSKRRLELNDRASVPLNKNLHSPVIGIAGYVNSLFGDKDSRQYVAKVGQFKLGIGDAEALRDYFVRMQRRNSNFFYVIDMDSEGRLRNAFWADSRSKATYEYFGDVVSFDTTYVTSKYNVPLASFVGVNHHGQSVLFGSALLSREDVDTYVWLFRSWMEFMGGRSPNVVITDQCRLIQIAIAEVLPQSHHCFGLWYIMRKLPEKLGGFPQYEEVRMAFDSILNESMEPGEFDEKWSRMIEYYNLQGNEWLSSLFGDRRHWAPVYVKSIFWAGNQIMNSFFDDYVNSKTSLKQFVELYDSAMKSKIEKENKADYDSYSSNYKLITDCHFEKQFQEAYTNSIFKLFQDELKGMLYCNSVMSKAEGAISEFDVSDILRGKDGNSKRKVVYFVRYNEAACDIKCSCSLFESRGLVCRHIAKILIEKDVREIPSRYILTRWRKDIKRRHSHVTSCYEDRDLSQQSMRLDKLRASFSEAAEVAINSQEKYDFLLKYIEEAKRKLMDASG
ncbi:protein FAR1-RELATED SEQUENCE 6-like [Punica granatum]|uniref:Protein FAR1-RELATED SEQUENCE n=2 Tax=Punica granatum TaxID=22663 RepID=A0A218XR34_PUNGR|nr:protein FAR1-RELATED SEQUENCE 6-like [Punica granatum]OWM87290.1 hypothetical protein CDL15_Pgr022397 [Punica granatum]PKI44212.1 hypothetical protein CRG98_035395 [Punica granatum]